MTDIGMLRPRLREMVDRELRPGETVRWVGQPGPSRMVRKAWPLQAFGLLGTLFVASAVIALLVTILVSPTYDIYSLLLIFASLSILSEPLGIRRRARSTVYVLTNKRAIVFEPRLMGKAIRSFAPEELGSLRRTEDAHGRGDLVFARDDSVNLPRVRYSRDTGTPDPNSREVGFMEIPEVKRVERLVKALHDEFLSESADR